MSESLEETARRLRREWEARSASPARDYFIASAPGWDDPAAWERQARIDAEGLLQGLEPEALARWEVLEIGCGVGRLVPFLAPRVRGYTGFDISAGMVAEARRRCAGVANARFLAGDGLTVPAAAADRAYALVLALAVFIHCPRDVIASLLRSAYGLLVPGGQIRFQVFTRWEDPTGLPPDFDLEAFAAAARQGEGEAPPGAAALIAGTAYMGHRFLFPELEPFLREATGGEVALFRGSPLHAQGWIRRP